MIGVSRRTLRLLVSAAAVSAALSTAASEPAIASDEPTAQERRTWEEANALYEDAHYEEARDRYRTLLEGGWVSADLLYNLGNAAYKAGALGEAVAAYRAGVRLAPRHRDLRANLEYVRLLAVDEIPSVDRPRLLALNDALVDHVAFHEARDAALALYWIAALVLCIRFFVPHRRRSALAATAALTAGLALLAGGLALERYRSVERVREAVVDCEAVTVRSGPAEDFPIAFSLHEGALVEVEEGRGDWLRVEVVAGVQGWAPADCLMGLPQPGRSPLDG
jgi:tetratricopeptide (TPR) repeat protein